MEGLAARLLRDYDLGSPGRSFDDPSFAPSLEEAYALQLETARLRELRGEEVAGYKIGCVSAAVQRQLGLREPVFGHIFGTEVHTSGAVLDVRRFASPAVEGELALRLACDVPGPDWLRAHGAEAVAGMFAVIELHNYVFRRSAPSAEELVANNALHAGVVCPPAGAEVAFESTPDETLRVLCNGELAGAATARELPGGPIGSLLALVELLAAAGRTLRAGQIVLTGSPLPLYPVGAGDEVRVESDRLPPVVASFR